MGFLGIYTALYDYAPQSEGELTITEGDVLYVLDKSDEDNWWKAKKKATADDDDEPVGLVPNNYVQEAQPTGHARSLYEYTRQTDEELSFPEDAPLRIYDSSDPDWILVGFQNDYGFVPANYIELSDAAPDHDSDGEASPPQLPPTLPTRPPEPDADDEETPPLPSRPSAPVETDGPAAALAGVMQGRRTSTRAPTPPPLTLPSRPQPSHAEHYDDEPSPALPTRSRTQSTYSSEPPMAFPPLPKRTSSRYDSGHQDDTNNQFSPLAPGGFHMYNINEMVSVMGKKKKMPTTLGVNLRTGVILIAPESNQDGPTQEWTADKMTHYSREGKHVFMELVRPSKSVDFHAGAKDTAEEIVSALGELSGAMKAEGLREVIAAGTGQGAQKRAQMLYDFTAQGEDEVTVMANDEVLILDDRRSEEWWQVRRLKTGQEGVVPSSYVEVVERVLSPSSSSGVNAGKSSVAQNRLEEERLTKEAIKRDQSKSERSRRDNGRADAPRSGSSKPKPDPAKVRTWTDRSKSFSVEAQFLGLKEGKINLHKMNGVKIAVPLAKMSIEDIEYVERTTGISLDEDKPLAEVKRAKSMRSAATKGSSSTNVGASIEPPKSDYDWFQFFLSCDVAVGLCERYAQAFARDSMDESVLPDVNDKVLRNLGLREGDIIKVIRYLDKKFGRDKKKTNRDTDGESGSGGLFSGPGGTLRNNTRKGRPAPAVQTNDVVDARAFSQSKIPEPDASKSTSPDEPRLKGPGLSSTRFDDDAWDVKPSRQPEPVSKPAPSPEPKTAPAPQPPPPTQAMHELSLLSTPLEPTKVEPLAVSTNATNGQQKPMTQPATTAPTSQPPGATPSFFTAISAAPIGNVTAAQPLNLGLGNRQRPAAPQVMSGQGALMPPPPARPLSAPQSAQSSGFAPPPMSGLQPQMTGIAPPGQSMNELGQQRMGQPYQGSFQPQPTGQGMMQFNHSAGAPQNTGFGSPQYMTPQMTGMPQQAFPNTQGQQFFPVQGHATGFPGFQPGQQFPLQQQQTGINSFLPPALEPKRTSMPSTMSSMQSQPTGFGGASFNNFSPPPMNGATQLPPTAPLQPQQTGPAPSVRFGVAKPIAPQPTGRRANLAQATPQNPFGF